MAILTIDKENFEQDVLNAHEPVIVDFWAPWCGYCRRLSPVIDRIEDEYGSQLKVAKLNIDDMPEAAEKYAVDTIPTLILFTDGAASDKLVNPPSMNAIEEWLIENGAIEA